MGDKVALLSLNSIEAVGMMFGVMPRGGVVVPLSTLLSPQQLVSIIGDSNSQFIFCDAPLQALTPVIGQIPISVQHRIAIGFWCEAWAELTKFMSGPSKRTRTRNLHMKMKPTHVLFGHNRRTQRNRP